ncbi:MAG: type II toxin-antitoxin system HigB family toxin [Aridibacter sp.]
MHIISRKAIRNFCKKYPNAEEPLDRWYRTTLKAEWENFAELREAFPSADVVGKCIVFNIGGNNFRLISKMYLDDQVCLIRNILTHKDYDKNKWKADCGV